jgi:tetratricopeptide (TPR) repeat protein
MQMRFVPLVALLLAAPLGAQTAAEHIALGDSANPFLHPDVALRHYREALALDSLNFAANWRAARAMADIAKQLEGDSTKDRRDSLYSVGRTYAERALRIDSVHAEGHYVVALVLGRLSRTRGGKERVRFARIIYDEAMRATQIDSTLDGAWHVLGAWNAEVKRLSGFTRFFAKALFGAGFMDKANWEDAQRFLERAVAIRPSHVYHRLELAQVYIDVGKYSRAREQLTTIATLPIGDVMDPTYKREAATLLADIRDKKDES